MSPLQLQRQDRLQEAVVLELSLGGWVECLCSKAGKGAKGDSRSRVQGQFLSGRSPGLEVEGGRQRGCEPCSPTAFVLD